MEEIEGMVQESVGQFVAWAVEQGYGETVLADLAVIEAVLSGQYDGPWAQAVKASRRVADQATAFESGGLLSLGFGLLAEAWMLEECRGWEP